MSVKNTLIVLQQVVYVGTCKAKFVEQLELQNLEHLKYGTHVLNHQMLAIGLILLY